MNKSPFNACDLYRNLTIRTICKLVCLRLQFAFFFLAVLILFSSSLCSPFVFFFFNSLLKMWPKKRTYDVWPRVMKNVFFFVLILILILMLTLVFNAFVQQHWNDWSSFGHNFFFTKQVWRWRWHGKEKRLSHSWISLCDNRILIKIGTFSRIPLTPDHK